MCCFWTTYDDDGVQPYTAPGDPAQFATADVVQRAVKMIKKTLKIIGHRGLPATYPENTLISFERAIAAGVDAIEFDVHRTADDRLVVTHDDTVERCSDGHGAVRAQTLAELRQLDFGGWKAPEFAGTRLPTLEETLDCLGAAPTLEILIELKENDEACTELLARELKCRRLVDRCAVLSFYANQLATMHELLPAVRLQGFRLHDFAVPVPNAYELITRLCIWLDQLDMAEIDRFHARGIQMDTCPVDTPAALAKALAFPVDTITTNAADVILNELVRRNSAPAEIFEVV